MHVLLQYQSKSYYIIGQEVYYSIGPFITLSGSYYIIGRFLLHYRAVITVSGVYYIIGWYRPYTLVGGIDGRFDSNQAFIRMLLERRFHISFTQRSCSDHTHQNL